MADKRRGRQVEVGNNQPVLVPDYVSGTEPDAVRNNKRFITIDGVLVRSNGSIWSAVGGGGSSSFDGLTDTPANKTSSKGRHAGVNNAENALIYLSDDPITFDLSSGNAVATDVQMIASYQFGPAAALTAARSITLPATLPKPFQAFNQSGSTNDLTITIGATSLTVAPGEQRLFYADGTANGLVALTDNGPSAFSGAKVSRFSTDQTLTTDTPTIAQYDLENYDVGGWANLGANNDRLVVPAGVSRAKITAGASFDTNATGGRNIVILIAGNIAGSQQVQASSSAGTTLNVSSAEEPVSPTDIIQARVTQRSGGNLDLKASENTFLAAVAIA